MQEKFPGELIFVRIHAGPVFALARIQENIFEEVFPEYFAKFLGEFTRCEYMPRLYSHLREYRKIVLSNYLGIGFMPGGISGEEFICETLGSPIQNLDHPEEFVCETLGSPVQNLDGPDNLRLALFTIKDFVYTKGLGGGGPNGGLPHQWVGAKNFGMSLKAWGNKPSGRMPQDHCQISRNLGSSKSLSTRSWGKASLLTAVVFCLQLSFFAYSLLRCLLDAFSHCQQKGFNCNTTVGKEAHL